jgi:hypothetical protein
MTPEERKAARDALHAYDATCLWPIDESDDARAHLFETSRALLPKALDALDERDRLLRDARPFVENADGYGYTRLEEQDAILAEIDALLGGKP